MVLLFGMATLLLSTIRDFVRHFYVWSAEVLLAKADREDSPSTSDHADFARAPTAIAATKPQLGHIARCRSAEPTHKKIFWRHAVGLEKYKALAFALHNERKCVEIRRLAVDSAG